jgi:transcription-repair coupling factor (superfamily II helicase)
MSENQKNILIPVLNSQPGKHNSWGQLYGSSDALVIAQAAQQAGKDSKPVIVITPDTPSATRLEYDIRFYADENIPVLIFPDWEILPYDVFSPHQDIISERLSTLSRLPALKQGVLIVPVATLLHRLAPTHFLEGNCFQIDVGQKLDLQSMRVRLDNAGYRRVSQVIEHGEFAVRGSILDLFPMGNTQPFRIELFDDEVESIRSFDPESQRSIEKINKIDLLPAREFPFTKDAITQFARPIALSLKATHRPALFITKSAITIHHPELNITYPCFSKPPTHCLIIYLMNV